jgi:hypothetical protein
MNFIIPLIAFAKDNALATHALAAVAQAVFAFGLIIFSAVQISINWRVRKDGIARDSAFVFFTSIQAFSIYESTMTTIVCWCITPMLENSGTTPANDTLMCANMYATKDGIPPEFDYPDYVTSNNPEQTKSFVGPHHQIGSGGFECSVAELTDVKAGNKRLFFYGWVEYNDVFRRFHRSEYCIELRVEGEPTKKDCVFGYDIIGEYNGNDRNCYRKRHEHGHRILAERMPRPSRVLSARPAAHQNEPPFHEQLSKRNLRRLQGKQRATKK